MQLLVAGGGTRRPAPARTLQLSRTAAEFRGTPGDAGTAEPADDLPRSAAGHAVSITDAVRLRLISLRSAGRRELRVITPIFSGRTVLLEEHRLGDDALLVAVAGGATAVAGPTACDHGRHLDAGPWPSTGGC